MTLFLFLLSCVELSSKYATDDDGDGYSEFQGDCDDANRFINPGATEYCDGIDNDCNNIVDQDFECIKKFLLRLVRDGRALPLHRLGNHNLTGHSLLELVAATKLFQIALFHAKPACASVCVCVCVRA